MDTAAEAVWTRTGRHRGNQLTMRSVVLSSRGFLELSIDVDVDVDALSILGLISLLHGPGPTTWAAKVRERKNWVF